MIKAEPTIFFFPVILLQAFNPLAELLMLVFLSIFFSASACFFYFQLVGIDFMFVA